MRKITRELQSFNAVGAGQVANLSIPTDGPTYRGLILEHKHDPGAAPGTLCAEADFGSNVDRFKLKLDGEPLWDISGQELVDLNNYYGIPMVAGYFPVPFIRPEFLDVAEENRFAIGTKGVRNFTCEVTLNSGVTSPELRAFASLQWAGGQAAMRPLGQVIRVRSTSYGAQAAAGTREIHDLPVVGPEQGRGLRALHIKAANIASHEVLLNDAKIDEGPEELNNLLADFEAFQTVSRTPQTGYYHMDFTGNRYSGIVPTQNARDFRLKLEFDGANAAFPIIHEEVIGVPDM
nr:hypothetical protein 7 [Moraxellaceae bacterium]